MSEIVPAAIERLPRELRPTIRITQQAREEDVERVTSAYAQASVAADVQAFFKDLPRRMADAHLVVSRSGASTVAELAAIGRPSILVPLPGALDQDQAANAAILGGDRRGDRDPAGRVHAGAPGERDRRPPRATRKA